MTKTSLINVKLSVGNLSILNFAENNPHVQEIKLNTLKKPDEINQSIKSYKPDLFVIQPKEFTLQVENLLAAIKSFNKPILLVLPSPDNQDSINKFYAAGVTEILPEIIAGKELQKRLTFYRKQHENVALIEKLKSEKTELKRELFKKTVVHKKLRTELSSEITEHIASIFELKKSNNLLSKRNKELLCLIQIAELKRKELPLDTFIQKIIETVPAAFQYPDLMCAEISMSGKFYRSENYQQTDFKLSEEIKHNSSLFGELIVYFQGKTTPAIKNIFLAEEKQLLRTISGNLGHYFHRKNTDNRLNIFRRAIDQSPLMITISNAKTTKIEYVNPTFSSVTGFNIEDMNSLKPYRASKDTTLKPLIEKMIKTVLEGNSWTDTYKNYKKGGELFWQHSSLYPLFEDGIVSHVLSISEDISKKIEFEEELKVSKENYEHITQNAPGGIFIVNGTGNILYANKKASEITGYSNSEIVKSSIQDIVHPDQVNKIYKNLDSRLSGQTTQNNYEAKIVTKKGEIKNLEVSGTKTKWKGADVDLIVVYDITLKKRFSNLLKIQNEIDYMSRIPMGLNQSFEKIFKTIYQFDWVNGGGIYLMNKSKKELNLAYSIGISSKFKKAASQYKHNSEQFKLVQQKRTTYLKSDNLIDMPAVVTEEGFKSLLVIPLVHDNNAIGCLNLASKSVTEVTEDEKMIFEAIANRIAQMITLILTQEELHLKNQKLQETLEEIQEKQQLLIQKSKLESLGEMAAGVAHEINQPLGIISLSLENVLYKVSKKNATVEYLDEKFKSIFNNIEKIEEIIAHIRTFSRDHKSLIIERIDINDVIKKAYSLINEQYSFYDISVILNLGENIGHTFGNSHKLEQVIYNLFSNAKYAIEEKDNALSDINFKKEIIVTTFKARNKSYIIFEDNGTGIENDKLEKVFNPFFTTKPEGLGTGLGLSIVYGIIVEMKGKITIESQKNNFTKVKIELPTH